MSRKIINCPHCGKILPEDLLTGVPRKKAKCTACVIINGTIRNDYAKDYYFAITANVCNSTGQKIETILTVNSPRPGFTVAKVCSNSTGTFAIQIPYDGKDITSYDLLLAYEPTENPPP